MRGVVIGKFYPPHLGHNYLIDTALKNCDDVDVLVVDNPAYGITSERRAAWLQARHSHAHVKVIPDIYDDDNSAGWALHTLRFLGYTPDVVYSSEPYGKTWAQSMGCKHVDVDIARRTVPISGTEVRRDFLTSWNYLSDQTKAGLAIRIVVVGAESTGTTTLSRALAQSLQVPYVPELGRYYTESLTTQADSNAQPDYVEVTWTNQDFYNIGRLQQQYENTLASRSNGVIVCDTNATATELWQRRYLGTTTPEMKSIAKRDIAHLYIITGDEIPFTQDGIRDGQHIRSQMHRWFIRRIKQSGVPYIIATGTPAQRLAMASKEARRIIQDSRTIT